MFKKIKIRNIVIIAIIVALIMLIPTIGNIFVEGWNWALSDFLIAAVFLFVAGLSYEIVSSLGNNGFYRAAVAVGTLTGVLLIWINAAVGIIGEDNPANLMYFGLLMIGVIGAFLSFFKPRGMAITLFSLAIIQMLIPIIALMIWGTEPTLWNSGILRVFILNMFFATCWVISGSLFRQSAIIGSRRKK